MNSILSQAEALRSALSGDDNPKASQVLAQSIIRCSEELIPAGYGAVALELLTASDALIRTLSPEWVFRIRLAHAEAMISDELSSRALETVRELALRYSDIAGSLPDCAFRLRILEGTALWQLGRHDEAVAMLTQTRGDLLARGDSGLLARCTTQLSAAYWMAGAFGISRDLAMDAIVAARRSKASFNEAQALTDYARMARHRCRWAETEEALQHALRIHDALGQHRHSVHARHGLALLMWKRGRLSEALELSLNCDGELRKVQPTLTVMSGLLKCGIYLHQGRYIEARQLALSVPEDDWRAGILRARILSYEFVGDVSLEQGEALGALRDFDESLSRALALAPKGDIVAELRRRRAECFYLLGRFDEAYAEAKGGLEHCRELGDRYEEAATYRVLALSAAAVGRPDEAKKWFDQGFAYYDDIETPYEWGKLWMAYGDWLLGPHAGAYADRKGALEAYHAARDHFERMGAEGKLAEVMRKLESLVDPSKARSTSEAEARAATENRPTPRRPRRSTELDRRAAWAMETFRIVTRNKAMLALLDDVSKLAPSDTPILVLGESGTGKELVARGIHALSARKGQFMAINAGSLPREIIESELFGHVAGAFTGATRDKAGMFEVCAGGTVFLDEIAEMSVELQSRLLRFLETGESRRVGANGNIAVDTRIIAATNRDRGTLERGEGFRLDLYYRLAHAVIALPPLRHRGEDVELLVGHFLEEACTVARRRVRLSPAAMRRLLAYTWPGNVRQLRAMIKRVVLLSVDGHEVGPEELQLENAEVPTTLIEELEVAERRRVSEALAQSRGSRTDAARILGMPRTTLINKMRRYGLK